MFSSGQMNSLNASISSSGCSCTHGYFLSMFSTFFDQHNLQQAVNIYCIYWRITLTFFTLKIEGKLCLRVLRRGGAVDLFFPETSL